MKRLLIKLIALSALLICAAPWTKAQTPPANAPVIVLWLNSNNSFSIQLVAEAANTPVWIETADQTYTQKSVGTIFTTISAITPTRNWVKIYGEVSGAVIENMFTLNRLIANNHGTLKELNCYSNQKITSIDVSGSNNLKRLSFHHTPMLMEVNVAGCSALNEVAAHNSGLSSVGFDRLYCGLPMRSETGKGQLFVEDYQIANPAVRLSNSKIATDKHWAVMDAGTYNVIETTGTLTCEQLPPATPPSGLPWVHISLRGENKPVELSFKAATPNTPVWIEIAGDKISTLVVGPNYSERIKINPTMGWIRVHGNITGLDCSNNSDANIEQIELYETSTLTEFNCSGNSIDYLKIYENAPITKLNCSNNALESLPTKHLRNLRELDCSENQLEQLSLYEQESLVKLNCSFNNIATLDLSSCTKLEELACNSDEIVRVNIQGLSQLRDITCSGPNFTTAALNNLYCALPTRPNTDGILYAEDSETSGSQKAILSSGSIATGKGWKIKYKDNNSEINTTGNLTCNDLTIPANAPVVSLTISRRDLTEGLNLLLKANAENTPVWVETSPNYFERITVGTGWSDELSFTITPEMSELNIPIAQFDVRVYGNISGFDCSGQRTVMAVDPSGNTQLQELLCHTTSIYTLNVNGLNSLKIVSLYGSNVTSEVLNNLYCALPTASQTAPGKVFAAFNSSTTPEMLNEKALASSGDIAKGKNWGVLYFENETEIPTTGSLTCQQLTPPANAPYLELTIASGNSIPMALQAAEDYTPAWVELAPNVYQYFEVGTSLGMINVNTLVTPSYKGSSIFKLRVYGNIVGFSGQTNPNIIGIKPSENNVLRILDIGFTGINNLDASAFTSLEKLYYFSQSITASDLNHLYCTLPQRANSDGIVYAASSPETSSAALASNGSIATGKGWTVKNISGDTEIVTTGTLSCEQFTPPADAPVITLRHGEISDYEDLPVKFSVSAAAKNTPVWIEIAAGNFMALEASNAAPTAVELIPPMEVIMSEEPFDIRIYGAVETLDLTGSNVLSVDASGHTAIKTLEASNISILNLNGCTALENLICKNSSMEALDITTCTALKQVDCSINYQIKELDLSGNPNLEYLNCANMRLNGLDISGNPALKYINCEGTEFSTAMLNSIYCSLPQGNTADNPTIVVASDPTSYNANAAKLSSTAIAKEKNWKVAYANGADVEGTGENTCGTVGAVMLSQSARAMKVGTTTTLTATVLPLSATSEFTWSSSNPEVATISNGVVTAIATGTATITVTTTTGGYTATCNIEVIEQLPAGLTTITLTVAKAGTTISHKFESYGDSKVWYETEPGIYIPDEIDGSERIPATTGTTLTIHGEISEFYCTENSINLTGIEISGPMLQNFECGDSQLKMLKVTDCPKITAIDCSNNRISELSISNCPELTILLAGNNLISSPAISNCARLNSIDLSNNQISAFDASGYPRLRVLGLACNPMSTIELNALYCSLLPVKTGYVVIAKSTSDANYTEVVASSGSIATNKGWTLIYHQNYAYLSSIETINTTGTYTCGSVYGVTINESERTISRGDSFTLTANVLPANANDPSVIWSSSNTNVATVNNNGEVTGLAGGTTTITATTTDGSFEASCTVTVRGTISIATGIANGNIVASPYENLDANTPITITVTPAAGYKLTEASLRAYKTGDESVTVNITVDTDGRMSLIMPAFDVTVTANFEALPQVLTLANVANGTITATPNQGIVTGTEITLTTTPANGYKLVENSLRAYKTGDESVAVNITVETDGRRSLIMPAFGVTVTAEFVIIPVTTYAVTIAEGITNGTVAANPTQDLAQGTEVTITVTPAAGYKLTEGSLRAYKTTDENVTVTITNNKMVMPAHNVTVTAKFELGTGIDTPTGTTVALHPNPANDMVYIKGISANTRVDIYNIVGTLVLSTQAEPNQSISVDNLKTGVYLVKVNGQTLRLIKN